LDFTANGHFDDGTLWIVREIQVPAGTWDVGVTFDVWTP
jgi:hypothetical protein